MEKQKYVVWLSDTNRIASFHGIDGYEVRTSYDYEFFMGLLHSLQEQGYRFQ